MIIPAEVALSLRLLPGAEVELEPDANGLKLHRPTTHLTKVHGEPTNHCNLHCRTCMRNSWNIAQGMMDTETFERILAGLASFSPPPTVFFGGLGEPLSPPEITELVARSQSLGSQVELITKRAMKKTVSAALSQPAAAASGPRGSSNVHSCQGGFCL